jgi:F420-0:gamma-glutamyl ligase
VVTVVGGPDEGAAAAEGVLATSAGVAAAIIRGVERSWFRDASVRAEIVRPPAEDLFR